MQNMIRLSYNLNDSEEHITDIVYQDSWVAWPRRRGRMRQMSELFTHCTVLKLAYILIENGLFSIW